jgi:hypothetical protein
MNPDQNQYSIDYLNKIAPQDKKPAMNNKVFLFAVGGGLLLAIIVGIIALSSGGGGPKEQMQTLAARLTTLKGISDKSQKNLKSNTMRSTNSNLILFLSNANRDIVEPLKSNGVSTDNMNKTITTKEGGEALTKKLEDARLNAIFDRTYAREMGFQLETTSVLMKSIYNSTNSKSLKAFLEATDANLQPIKKQMTDFNAATS